MLCYVYTFIIGQLSHMLPVKIDGIFIMIIFLKSPCIKKMQY